MYDHLTDVVELLVVMPVITSCNPIARGVLLGDDTVVSPSRSRNCHMIKAAIVLEKKGDVERKNEQRMNLSYDTGFP
jgi:hypothetical protein